jgi:hypothetical protein
VTLISRLARRSALTVPGAGASRGAGARAEKGTLAPRAGSPGLLLDLTPPSLWTVVANLAGAALVICLAGTRLANLADTLPIAPAWARSSRASHAGDLDYGAFHRLPKRPTGSRERRRAGPVER